MKNLLWIFAVCLTAFAFGGGEEAGHMHGPDGRHVLLETDRGSTASFVLSHHDLRIEAPDGSIVRDAKVLTTIIPRHAPGDSAHIELNAFEPENDVYGSHFSYSAPGEYILQQDIELADGREFALEFPIFVQEPAAAQQSTDHPHGPEPFTLLLGAVAAGVALYAAYRLGRRNAKAGGGVAGAVLLGWIALSLSPHAYAGGEEAGHMHGPDGRHVLLEEASSPAGKPLLKAFTSSDRSTTATQTVDGYTFTITMDNEEVAPDPDLLSITPDQAELIGLQTARAELSPMGGGLQATGVVATSPDGLVHVNARTGGVVVEIMAQPGARVKRGQVLAVLESQELAAAQSALRSAQAELSQAQAGVAIAHSAVKAARTESSIAERELARQEALASAGEFTSPALEAAKRSESEARAAEASLRAELERLKAALDRQRRGHAAGVVALNVLEQTESELKSAQAAYADAQTRLQTARAALEREQAIADQGLRSAKEVESARARFDLSMSSLHSALDRKAQADSEVIRVKAAIHSAGELVRLLGATPGGGARSVLRAPMDGVVEAQHVAVGQTLSTGSPIFELLNDNLVWVMVDVFEKDLAKVQEGQGVEAVSQAFPNRVYEGRVASIQNLVNPASRTSQVRVVIENSGGLLKAGMFLQVILASGDGEVVIVPASAIQREGGLDYVLVREAKSVFRKTLVQVLFATGGRRAVQGISAGDEVATHGSYQLLSLGGGE